MHNLQYKSGIYERIGGGYGMQDPFSYNRMRAIIGDRRTYAKNKQDKEPIYETCPQQFNSLKLLENNNDNGYLDQFMAQGKNRRSNSNEETVKNMLRNQYNSKKKDDKKKLTEHTKKLAFLGNLSKCKSVEQIYESVETIHYRKTLHDMNKRDKLRSLQKSGHPLFDHLREEQVLSGNKNQNRFRYKGYQVATSNGSSPSPSSSDSGDEFDTYLQHNTVNKPDPEYVYIASLRRQNQQNQNNNKNVENVKPRPQSKPVPHYRERDPLSSTDDSDEDWAKSIPRPSLISRPRRSAGGRPVSNYELQKSKSSTLR